MSAETPRRDGRTVATAMRPVVELFLGSSPRVCIECWDGSLIGSPAAPARLVLRSPDALRRVLWSPDELGLGRAYVAGDLDVEGDIYAGLALREAIADADDEARIKLGPVEWLRVARAARQLHVLGRPLRPPAEEVHLRGRRHSPGRDAAAISHHYDVPADFYRLVLGPTLTYSCAYFEHPDLSLDEAQVAKYDLVAAKLGLRPGMRLLDVGCGWGGMVIRAAQHHGVRAVGVTLSAAQAEAARRRVVEAGLDDRVEIRHADYREIADGPYDAISSIGMFEHVGEARLSAYFGTLFALLRPGGRLLNHAISRPPGASKFQSRSFIERYVFPDGELLEVGRVVSALQDHGFEVRDVENLREHYARTLRHWVANLEANWEEAVRLAGVGRARVWRLYMAASALNFEAARCALHQTLGVRLAAGGDSLMPPTRREWLSAVPVAGSLV